jgi:seryl-tRNA synthetase
MLDIKYIRENAEEIKKNSKNRKADVDIDELLRVDEERKKILKQIEDLRAERNTSSKSKPSPEEIERIRKVGDEIKSLENSLIPIEEKFNDLILEVPNLTHPEVKVSDIEDENPVIETYLTPTEFNFEPLDHEEIGVKLDLIDMERAVKVTGAKFYYLKNELAVLEFALIQYAIETAVKHGFTPFVTPDLAKREVLERLGFNPRGESTQVYNVEKSNLSLIGTAEITMGGYHKDEVISEKDLPKKYVAVSHCFRTEAGSYSKFSKGIFRVHQFTKVEMFEYVMPSESEKAHKEILEIEKEIFSGLKIPFRVVDHTTADLGAPAYRTFDLEAWMPGKPNKDGKRGDWAEITSTSNCTDYQSRGLNIKFEDKEGKKEYLHMLNGTAIAVGRALIALVENFQRKDGTIQIPEVLHRYCKFAIIPGKRNQ